MKILAINIYNLASLEGHTSVDFTAEPLASAGIFAITGPTGAGKSTLLDALCLALYGKTPRYIQGKEKGVDVKDVKDTTINQGDVRGILRNGTAEGSAEVIFEGVDGKKYAAKWSVRRARQRADGAIQTDNMQLQNLNTGEIVASKKLETLAAIEQAVGLNFDQFTRSVLLAQGDFSAFLKAKKDDKSALLEKLTGTQVYSEISQLTYERYQETLKVVNDLKLKADGVERLSEEQIALLTQEQEALAEQLQDLHAQKETLRQQIDWHQQLEKLRSGVQVAEQELAFAKKQDEEAAPRKIAINHVEAAQEIAADYRELINAKKESDQKKASLTQLEAASEAMAAQHEQLQGEQQESIDLLAAAKKNKETAQPELDVARKLDHELQAIAGGMAQLAEELQKATTLHEALEKEKSEAEHEKLDAQRTISRLQEWQERNAARQPIAENHKLIESKLKDAEEHWTEIQKLESILGDTEIEIRKKEEEITTIKAEIAENRLNLAELESALQKQKSALDEAPQASLTDQINTIRERKDALMLGKQIWKDRSKALLQQTSIADELQKQEAQKNTLQEQIGETKQQLTTAEIARKTSEQMLHRAQLESAKDVEQLRENLEEGEPCPVCGSTDHPYAERSPEAGRMLKGLEEEHAKNQQTYDAAVKQLSALETELKSVLQQLSQQNLLLAQVEEELKKSEQQWEDFSLQKEIAAVKDTEKSGWFEGQIDNASEQINALNQAFAERQKNEKAYADQKQKQEQLKDENLKAEKLLDAHEYELKTLKSGSERELESKETASEALSQIERGLGDYFQNSDWLLKWKGDPDDFMMNVKSFAKEWQSKTEELEKAKETLRQAENQFDLLQEKVSRAADDHVKANKKHRDEQATFEQLQTERKALFEGRSVQDVVRALDEAEVKAQHQLESKKQQIAQLENEQVANRTETQGVKETIEALTAVMTEKSQLINQWLVDYNASQQEEVSKEMLNRWLSVPSDWLKNERAQLKQLSDALLTANTRFAERKEQLDLHVSNKPTATPYNELQLHLTEVNTEENTKQKRSNEIGFELKKDAENKQRFGALLEQIEQKAVIADQWAKLNELIGSADGKKFRQIAQEYTLDVLLSYANKHLQLLTNRYVIERIADTLGLQVLDQDMGDEYRTVYSLSGGESFLVSLALALGLASISSNKMKVESLFIDEGFGTLDPATLNIAMDALERLHNQGRKVGVISHVEEMKERIPVQIKVTKLTNGRSKVIVE